MGSVFMVTVSQFLSYKRYYKLDKNIPCEKLCQDISELVNLLQANGQNSQESILTIEIKTIDQDNGDGHMPKIEHKQ